MKKPKLSLLVVITVVFASFTLGLFLGRNQVKHPISVSVSPAMLTEPAQLLPTQAPTETTVHISFPININTADKDTLMALPGIGETLAQRILAYRSEHGSFSSAEGLMAVEGIGEKRIEEILSLITIGG